jgi:hypothetical protein
MTFTENQFILILETSLSLSLFVLFLLETWIAIQVRHRRLVEIVVFTLFYYILVRFGWQSLVQTLNKKQDVVSIL